MQIRPRRGFTIMELLITIVIIGLASSIVIPQLQAFRLKNTLKTTINQLKADIRQTRTWSQAVRNGTPISGFAYNDTLVAYAIHFDSTNNAYTIWEVWQDSLGNQASFANVDTPTSRKIVHPLPSGIVFSSINPNNSDIFFDIPSGQVSGDLGAGSFQGDKIVITLTLKTIQNTISVWQHGDLS
jgi:prepilin-type N-terminal cleavage/methylation domain-containing protein